RDRGPVGLVCLTTPPAPPPAFRSRTSITPDAIPPGLGAFRARTPRRGIAAGVLSPAHGAVKCELWPGQPIVGREYRGRTPFKFAGWPHGGVGRPRPDPPPVTEWPYWVGRC